MIYIWHLLFCCVHRSWKGRTCTQYLIFGIAVGPSLVPSLGPALPGAARHAQSEATRFVTANCT